MRLGLDSLSVSLQTDDMPIEDYLSVAECARILDVSTDAIYAAIKKGQLEAEWLGGVRVVHKDALAKYRKEKRSPGRPRIKRGYNKKTGT